MIVTEQQIKLAKPYALSCNQLATFLENYFNNTQTDKERNNLELLAIYAMYLCLFKEFKRFDGKTLLAIESHTSADTRSGRIGDIEIVDQNNKSFEAVEVKHGIVITLQLVQDAYSKFQTTQVNRFYILSTAQAADELEWNKIQEEVKRIKNVHGCQVIVNGVMPTLKYYLRLLENTADFIDNYVNLIENDKALKFEHKVMWNELNGQLT